MLLGQSRILGGILLVAGTTIGVAMLVLPISTGLAGFIPAATILCVFWAFMTFSAFCFLEVSLWVKRDTDIISMARKTLGPWGERFSWTAYLFLLYSLTTAYIALSAPIFVDFISFTLAYEVPEALAPIPMLLVFIAILYRGTHAADLVNRCLMAGLCLVYCLLVYFVFPHVSLQKLEHQEWGCLGMGFSVVATSFGYHIIIPSLMTYMRRDIPSMKLVLLVGGLVPLLINLLWELLALGVIPIEGGCGLRAAHDLGLSSAHLLKDIIQNPIIAHGARFLSFFAITTSFLGVSLSLYHFLADGLRIKRSFRGRMTLSFLTFVPPLLVVWTYPRAAFTALEYAGVIGVVCLLGLMPCLMVWVGRYWRGLPELGFRVFGGRITLGLAVIFAVLVLLCEIFIQTGFIDCCV